jgi:high-affinity nickel-transport protein
MNPLALLGLGLLLGMRHATDADHVVAVAAITARTRRVLGAARLGMVWGLGHTLTIFVVGAAIILFNIVVPPRVGLAFEFAVALALIVVGLLNFNRPHRHDDGWGPGPARAEGIPALRAFVVGLVHGLAGSAAVALLVLATVRDTRWACGYLLVFGVGTMLGMALVTVSMAAPLAAASERWRSFGHWTRLATGSLSLCFGLWLVYEIGWRQGLFLATVHWTPR